MTGRVIVLGAFVVDVSFRAPRHPRPGETVLGESFALGPGGKGSNQAVAAARAGAETHFVTRIGEDDFGQIGRRIWAEAGVRLVGGARPRTGSAEGDGSPFPRVRQDGQTGAAGIFVNSASGENAIVVCPGAASTIGPEDLEPAAAMMAPGAIFVTQFEQPMAAAMRGLELARAAGATTVLNPAPAAPMPAAMLALCDYVIPNESEAEALTGMPVEDAATAARAAERLVEAGAGAAIVTLGAQGAVLMTGGEARHEPAFDAGEVVDTTGAGDAFIGAFAAALARGARPSAALREGCAGAAIAVTRPGTAAAMPTAGEIAALARRRQDRAARG